MPENLPVLTRPRDGAVIAGVCAGVAQRLGMEARVVRIIAVTTVIVFSGLGAALYLAGVLLIPREGESLSPLVRAVPALRRWPKGLLIAVVIAALVAIVWGSGGGAALVPLVVVGLVLWFGVFRHRYPRSFHGPELTPFERAADAWRVRLAEQHVPGFERYAPRPGQATPGLSSSMAQPTTTAPPPPPGVTPFSAVPPQPQATQGSTPSGPSEQQWQQPYTDPSDAWVADNPVMIAATRRRPRRSWRLWGVALAAIGLATGVVAVAGFIFGLPTSPLAYWSATLAGLGLTCLLAARLGRPPLLVPATIVASVITATQLFPTGSLPISGPVGDYTAAVTSESQLPASIQRSAGDVKLDLSGLNLSSDRTVQVKVGAGDVQITLPRGEQSDVTWQLGVGTLRVNNTTQDELGRSGQFSAGPLQPATLDPANVASGPGPQPSNAAANSSAKLHLQIEVGAGDLEVRQ